MFGMSRQQYRVQGVNGIRVVLLESSPLLRYRLQAMIAEDSTCSVVGCTDSWDECQTILEEYLPELLVAEGSLLPCGLDLEMPGFPLLLRRPEMNREEETLDSVFKDFRNELSRVRHELYSRKACELSALLDRYLTGLNSFSFSSTLKAFHSGECVEIPVTQIQVIEASGNYVRIYASGKVHIMREAISCLQAKLDPAIFIRAHRSYLVNLRCISRLSVPDAGSQLLFLQDGSTIPIGPNYRDEIVRLFESAEKLSA
jgi:hypothetical protein